VEQNIRQALTIAEYGYILENGSIVLQDLCKNLLKNESVKKSISRILRRTKMEKMKTFKAATTLASPIFLDKDGTIEKVKDGRQ
jgi:hypothetical protein